MAHFQPLKRGHSAWLFSAIRLISIPFLLALAASASATSNFSYDDLDRLFQATDGAGATVQYNYDPVGNILSVQNSAYSTAAPTISAVSPAAFTVGSSQSVTLLGTNLSGAVVTTDNPGIVIGGISAISTKVTATLSPGYDARIGPTNIIVSTPWGTATVPVTVNGAAPVLSLLNPSSGPVTRLISIQGNGFSSTAASNQITFNGLNTPVLFATNTQLQAQVPTGAASGNVVVTTNGIASNPLPFTVQSSGPAPVFTSIYPASASADGGTLVKIAGNNFTSDTKVFLGSLALQSLIVVNATTITGTVPSSFTAGPVNLLVTNANGDAFVPSGFTYLSAPNQQLVMVDPVTSAPTNTLVSLLFSRPVDRASITGANLTLFDSSNNPVSGTFSFALSDQIVVFKPTANLTPSTVYKLVVAQDVKSIDAIPLNAGYTGFFTTASAVDTISPTVVVSPANNATSVPYNSKIVFVFSEPINPISLNAGSVIVENNGVVRAGSFSVSTDRRSVIFTSYSPFVPNTQVKITVTPGVTDSAGNPVVGNAGPGSNLISVFTTATNADIQPPSVISVSPAANSAGASVNSIISLTFSEPIDVSTIDGSSVVVSNAGVPIVGNITIASGNTIVNFQPAGPLPSLTQIDVKATSGIKDMAGNGLQPFASQFTTQSGTDIYRPSIVTYSPYGSQGNVPLSAQIEVVFDEAIDISRLNSQSVVVQNTTTGEAVPGTLTPTADRKGVVFTPNQPLAANSTFYLFVGNSPNGGGTIYDLAGNPLLNPVWYNTFNTGITLADTVAPQVTAVNPQDGSSGFALNGVIALQFSKPVSPTSVNDQTIVVSAGGVPVAGEVGFRNNNSIVTFKPANLIPWNAATNYMVQVTNNIRDLSGNAALPFNSVFTTGTVSDTASPTLVSVVPASGGTIDPDLPATFTVTFNEPIDPLSLAGSLGVARGSYPNSSEAWMPVSSASLSPDQKVLTITADKPVVAGRYVSLFFNSGLRDIAGNGFTACGACAWENTQWSAPADLSTVFDSATVSVNPTALYADGQSTAQVTISGISKGGVLVPNGTQVAVTVDPIYRTDSVGGTILEGTASPHDARFKILTTLGGKVSFTYQSVNRPDLAPGQTLNSFVQVAPVDAQGRPSWSVNNTAIQLYRGKTASIGVNPASLLANGTSYANVSISVSDNTGTPLPAGTPVGVTVDKVYRLSSLGGTLSGGVPSAVVAQDARVKIYEVQPGGVINLTYTTPVLAAGQSGNASVQVVDVNNAGLVTGLLGAQNIGLNGSSGSTHPQPVLSYTTPANGQWNVGRNAPIVMVFSQPLDPSTVNSGTIWSYQGLAGSYVLSSGPGGPNSVVTFTPSTLLGASQSYAFYIYTSVKAADGQPLLTPYYYSFSTSATNDTTAPTVTAFNPANGMSAAPLNSTLRVQFSEPINPGSITPTAITLMQGSTTVPYRWDIVSGAAGPNSLLRIFTDSLLVSNSSYSLSVTAGVKDSAGIPAVPANTTFTTGTAADTQSPSVVSVVPGGGINIPVTQSVVVTFSKSLDTTSICCGNFVLRDLNYGFAVPGTVTMDLANSRLTFTPTGQLRAGASYRIDIGTGIRDVVGNALNAAQYVYFNTALAAGTGNLANSATLVLNPPDLYADGSAANLITVSNIVYNGTTVPNGTKIGITTQPVFASSVGGTISGTTSGASPDARFQVFDTLGGKVTAYVTPPDMRWLTPNITATTTVQIVSLDANNNPVALIASAPITLYGIGSVALSSTDPNQTTNHETILASVKDYKAKLVTDGSLIGVQAVDSSNQPINWGSLSGGTVSNSDSSIMTYATTGGQTTIGFDGPAGLQCHLGPVNTTGLTFSTHLIGTLRVITVNSGGQDTGLITTRPIECYSLL